MVDVNIVTSRDGVAVAFGMKMAEKLHEYSFNCTTKLLDDEIDDCVPLAFMSVRFDCVGGITITTFLTDLTAQMHCAHDTRESVTLNLSDPQFFDKLAKFAVIAFLRNNEILKDFDARLRDIERYHKRKMLQLATACACCGWSLGFIYYFVVVRGFYGF